jgi:hypothetical protein
VGKSGANRARAKAGEKAAGNESLIVANDIASAAMNYLTALYVAWFRFFLAALAPFFREQCACFSVNAQSSSFAVLRWPLS